MLAVGLRRLTGAHEDIPAGDQDVATCEGVLAGLPNGQTMRLANRLQGDAARPERRDEGGLDEILERKRRRAIDGPGTGEQWRPYHATVAVAKVQPAHQLLLRLEYRATSVNEYSWIDDGLVFMAS